MTGADGGTSVGTTPGGGRRIILDACALLNLYASGRIADVLNTMPRPSAVAEYIRDQEALWVGRYKTGPEADYEQVNIRPLVASGLIEVLALSGDEELANFLALASSSRIDDGEAICGAMAQVRDLVVVTDDKAALRVFGCHSHSIQTCSTASLMKHWAECMAVDAKTLQSALLDIRERACFEPGPRDPLRGWWKAAMNSA